ADGKRIGDISLDAISDVLERPDTFVWVGLIEPDEALLEKLQEEFGLHDLAIEDAHNAHQRPKIEAYGDSLFIVAQTAQVVDAAIQFGETHIFVGKRYLVTVAQGEVVKKLAGWAALLAAPTLLTSWYGMNFHHMPELDKPWGYPAMIAFTGLICGSLYWLLRRAKWL
ncbi:MAG: CorA family divalent cation transporter, partial [Dokdonella sp.]|uniref:CorA family divalent cation transporter n=1 Tax=Dokdonella sp. TaxID=2291710 RepID=UPI003BB21228